MGFNRKLTMKKGINAVGDIDDAVEIALPCDCDLVSMLKETDGGGPFNRTDIGRSIEKWLFDWKERSGIGVDTYHNLTNGRVLPSFSFDELLRNAIEHGSKFGELGPVVIRGIIGKAIFIVIDDSGEGFNYKPIGSRFNLRREWNLMDYQIGDRGKGLGGVNKYHERTPDVWFEKLVDGFRTKLLYASRANNEITWQRDLFGFGLGI